MLLLCAAPLPLPQEAERLSPMHQGSGPTAAKSQEDEAEEAIGNSLQTMGERYVGVKHTQVGAKRVFGALRWHL